MFTVAKVQIKSEITNIKQINVMVQRENYNNA